MSEYFGHGLGAEHKVFFQEQNTKSSPLIELIPCNFSSSLWLLSSEIWLQISPSSSIIIMADASPQPPSTPDTTPPPPRDKFWQRQRRIQPVVSGKKFMDLKGLKPWFGDIIFLSISELLAVDLSQIEWWINWSLLQFWERFKRFPTNFAAGSSWIGGDCWVNWVFPGEFYRRKVKLR